MNDAKDIRMTSEPQCFFGPDSDVSSEASSWMEPVCLYDPYKLRDAVAATSIQEMTDCKRVFAEVYCLNNWIHHTPMHVCQDKLYPKIPGFNAQPPSGKSGVSQFDLFSKMRVKKCVKNILRIWKGLQVCSWQGGVKRSASASGKCRQVGVDGGSGSSWCRG